MKPVIKSRPGGRLSKQISAYFKSYVRAGSQEDHYVCIFRALKHMLEIGTVLYPGCHRHITPSFFFPSVYYVDCDDKVAGLYSDEKALMLVDQYKEYATAPNINFSCKRYTDKLGRPNSFDLLISLSAGIVSEPCGKYIKPDGYLFVNDSHSDAKVAYLDHRFELIGVYDEITKAFVDDSHVLSEHFHTIGGEKITREMVNESIEKPRSRRSFKLKAESMFYLFQRKSPDSPGFSMDHMNII